MHHVVSTYTNKVHLDMSGGPVARLVIDNPERRNAMDLAMWKAIPELAAHAEREARIRVVVVTGKDLLPFCSGADISEFSTVRATAEGARAYEAANAAAYDALAQLGKPVIAAIRGFCLGGGMGLAAACDLRVASEGSQFGIPAGRLGVGYPPSSMSYVVATVGARVARDLFFTARRLDAAEAMQAGFLDRLVPVDWFDREVEQLADTIAANAPLTLRAAKAAIAHAANLPGAPDEAECNRLADACFESADYAEGRAAFLAKRPPAFEGK